MRPKIKVKYHNSDMTKMEKIAKGNLRIYKRKKGRKA